MPLYSYSRIGTFEQCPRKYKFRYIEKPDIEPVEGVEAFMGKMAHDTLQQCYRLAHAGRVPSAEELAAYYRRRWDEALPKNIKVVREGMTPQDYFTMGLKALLRYHARYAPFDQDITLGLERQVIFALDPDGRYKMQGYIDRLSRDNTGRLKIQDYKTSGTLPGQKEIDEDAQLALYQLAVEEMWPDNNGIDLIWHYLQFDTMLVSHRSRGELEELRSRYINKIRQIERAEELGNFHPFESALCDWCEYYALCPAKGGAGVAKTSPQEVIQPLNEAEQKALVDEFIAANHEKKDLEKRLDEIRRQLLSLGEIGSDKFLPGSGEEGIVLTLSRVAKLPTRSSNYVAVEEIRGILERAGLADDYIALDTAGLQKAYTSGALPDVLMEKLKPYESIEVQDRVRIKRK